MKIAIISDQHYGARADSTIFLDYFERFYVNIFFPTLKERNIKTIVDLGDTFDRRKYINFGTLNRVRKMWFEPIEENKYTLHSIIGNHTSFFKNTNEVNALHELFGNYKNIKIYKDPQEIDLDGLSVLVVPWINIENYERTINAIKHSKSKIVMGHLELSGFYMHKGIKNDSGMDKTIFNKFKQVFSGHYHHRSDDGKIFYLGSPYETTFADLKDTKGFHIFDTVTKKLEFIPNPYRMFHRVYYDDRGKTFDDLIGRKKLDKLKGTYIKIIVMYKTNPFIFDQFLERLYKAEPTDISVVENFAPEGSDVSDVDMAEDTLTILGKYVDGLDLDVNKDRIKDQLRSLYVEASSMDMDRDRDDG